MYEWLAGRIADNCRTRNAGLPESVLVGSHEFGGRVG